MNFLPPLLFCSIALLVANGAAPPLLPIPKWQHLSSRAGDLPEPNGGLQQTTAVVFDIDGDSFNDIVIGERTQAPGIIWLRRTARGWDKYLLDDGPRRTEAGGVAYDVDRDGDLDFIVGGDYKSIEIWWYENPCPTYDPKTPWKRHLIKNTGDRAHHDQAIADFKGIGRPQLAFWNQGPKKLLLADWPDNPRESGLWPITEILDVRKSTAVVKQEGMAVFDIDGDDRPDLLAGMFWFKHLGENEFKPIQFADHPGRVAAGRFKAGRIPQIVLAPGDGDGPLLLFECAGDPLDGKAWRSRDLLGTTVIHGHSLDVADINADGHLDIFCAEMAQWTEKPGAPPDHPKARAWILYGDGRGGFTTAVLATGVGFHDARVADLNGDGRLDILNKPYRFDAPRVDVWLNLGAGPPPAARKTSDGTNRRVESAGSAMSPRRNSDPPRIDIWYGDEQHFGRHGVPQKWVNVLGRITSADGLATLECSINSGPPERLSVGPDGKRLAREGDFNVDLEYESLRSGPNEMMLVGIDTAGRRTERKVTVHCHRGNVWPLPYTVDWSTVRSISDVVQVVDGNWRLEPAGIRTIEPYYDRILAFGDRTWTDYTVMVEVTFHSYAPPLRTAPTYGVSHAAIAARYPGHFADDRQPHVQWYPCGAVAEFRLGGNLDESSWRIFRDGGPGVFPTTLVEPRTRRVELGVPYMLKLRVDSLPGPESRYRVKSWKIGGAEPNAWEMDTRQGGGAIRAGGALLVSHNTDVTFGRLTVTRNEP